ncbi:MAG: hypothetical protein ACJAQT_002207, partial [Akkermansiaceae bacterium]
MSDTTTQHYAIPPDDYFWRWSPDGTAFEWSNGETLAFNQEIFAILQSLADQGGIPPLGSLLLVHAATTGQAEQFRKTQIQLRKSHPEEFDSAESVTLIDAVTHSLSQIEKLPSELKSGTQAKAQLCHALFNRSTWAHQDEKARLIVRDFQAAPIDQWLTIQRQVTITQRFLRDTAVLIKATAGLDASSLEHLVRTGLEFTDLSAAPFDETLTEETDDSRSLIEQLAGSGQDLSALASVAKQVIGLIALPLPAAQKADLPIGGVADIVNRGTPDKLLTSELAWGDDILALRLAQNEALFYHRETPPENTPSERIILLDHGLRYWGLLRLFALATHLGLRCHQASAKHLEVTNLIATPTASTPFPLDTPVHVRTALANLPIHLSFAPALADLTNQITQTESPRTVSDLFLISTPSSLKDTATKNNLHQLTTAVRHAGGRLYLIEIAPTGHLSISELRARGKRKLQEGTLDLDKLLPHKKDTHKQQTPKAKLTHTSLEKLTGSKFYKHYPPPVLFKVTPNYGPAIHPNDDSDTLIGIAGGAHIMKWFGTANRAKELSQSIPSRNHWLGIDEEGNLKVAASGEKAGESARVFAIQQDGTAEKISIQKTKHAFPRRAVFQGNHVIFIYADFAEAISLQSGQQVAARKSTYKNLHEQTIRLVNGAIGVTAVAPPDPRQKFLDKFKNLTQELNFQTIEPIQFSFTQLGAIILGTKEDGSYLLNPEKLTWDIVNKRSNFNHTLKVLFKETGARRF